MRWENGWSGTNRNRSSFLWIVLILLLFGAMFSGHGGFPWWLLFPLFWWIIPALRGVLNPDDHGRGGDWADLDKRKNDELTLEDDKPKRGRSPRYVLIGDGEIMEVDDEPDAQTARHDGYV